MLVNNKKVKERLIYTEAKNDTNGSLYFYQRGINLDFTIERVFVVKASKGDLRGNHAHKKCNQFLVCTYGQIKVICDDKEARREYILKPDGNSLHIPPGIWSSQTYIQDHSILMVMCDRKYEDADYIRSYSDFLGG